MNLDLDATAARTVLPAYLSGFASGPDLADALRQAVEAHVARWGDAEAEAAIQAVNDVGTHTRVWPANHQLRELARDYCRPIFPTATAEGTHHLVSALATGPVLLLGNHLAYIDSLAIDSALIRGGHREVADRIVSVAGPKVYADLFRRLAAACLHTVPAPQSTRMEHTARMSSKELARLAHESLDAARGALLDGQAVLLFGEGSRTRTGRLAPFVRGVHRYLGLTPELQIVPFALTGAGAAMAVGQTKITPSPVHVAFGAPFIAADLGSTRQALAAAWQAVAALLPPDYAPAPGTDPVT
ncbi:MAG: 1-acyl-sn-glycerol-3-phosphate acyltransferase [Myxococcota bacterium]